MICGKKFKKLASVICSFLMGGSGFSSAAPLSPYVSKADYDGVIELAKSVGLKNDSFDDIKKQIKDFNQKIKMLKFDYDCEGFGCSHSFLIKFGNDTVEFTFGRILDDESVCAVISLDDFCLLAKYFGFRLFKTEEIITTKNIFDVKEDENFEFEFLRFLRCLVSGESDDKSKEMVQNFIKSPEKIFEDSFSFCKSGEAPYLFSIGYTNEFGNESRIIDFQKYLTYLVSLIKLRNSGLSEEEIDKKIKEISKPVEKPVKNPVKKGFGKTGTVCVGVGGVIAFVVGVACGLHNFSNKGGSKRKKVKKDFKERIKKQKKFSKKVNRLN